MAKRRLTRWRAWVQGLFLLAWLDPFLLRMHSVCAPVFHCYSCPLATFACPIGMLAQCAATHALLYLPIGTLLLVGAVVGSLICGWVCPFGLLQDLLGRIPTRKFALPVWTGYTRYAVLLGLVLAVPYLYGKAHPLFICSVCPAGALEGAVPNVVRTAVTGPAIDWPSPTKGAILGVFLVASVFIWRPWCTLFCPLGAIYGLLNRASFFFVRFDPEGCTDCNLCKKLCHYRGHDDRRAGPSRCVRCLDCVDSCQAITIGMGWSGENKPSPTEAEPERGEPAGNRPTVSPLDASRHEKM